MEILEALKAVKSTMMHMMICMVICFIKLVIDIDRKALSRTNKFFYILFVLGVAFLVFSSKIDPLNEAIDKLEKSITITTVDDK